MPDTQKIEPFRAGAGTDHGVENGSQLFHLAGGHSHSHREGALSNLGHFKNLQPQQATASRSCEVSGRALSGIQLENICVTFGHRIGQDPISVLKV